MTTLRFSGEAALISYVACLIAPTPAKLETLSFNNAGASVQAAWTTCPESPVAGGTYCNYTEVYAAQATAYKPFFVLTLANLYQNASGATQVVLSAQGIVNPSTKVALKGNLSSGLAYGGVYLYGSCGSQGDYNTCIYYGIGGLYTSWTGTGDITRWVDTKTIYAPGNVKFAYSESSGARTGSISSYAVYEGEAWALGRQVNSRMIVFNHKESLLCPAACSAAALASRKVASAKSRPPAPQAKFPPTTGTGAVSRATSLSPEISAAIAKGLYTPLGVNSLNPPDAFSMPNHRK